MKYVSLIVVLTILLFNSRTAIGQNQSGFVTLSSGYYNNSQIRITCAKEAEGNEEAQTGRLVFENLSSNAFIIRGVITVTTYCGAVSSMNFKTLVDGKGDYHYTGWSRITKVDKNVSQEVCKGKRLSDSWMDRISNVSYMINSCRVMPKYVDCIDCLIENGQSNPNSPSNNNNPNQSNESVNNNNSNYNTTKTNQQSLGLPVAPTNNNTFTNINSQQTQVYINQAQNTNNNAIQNQLALNQAKANAMKQGGATQAQKQQIQQMQTDLNNKTIEKTTDAVVNFINVLTKPKNIAPKETEAEMDTRIKKEVQEDAEAKGYIFDTNGIIISSPQERAHKAYLESHQSEIKENFNLAGKYTKEVVYSVDMLKTIRPEFTRAEAMDYIAEKVWKYSENIPSKTSACNVTDQISFLDSVFRYTFYRRDLLDKEWDKIGIKLKDEEKFDFSLEPFNEISISSNDDFYDCISIYTSPKRIDKKVPNYLHFTLSVDCMKEGDVPYKIVNAFTVLLKSSHNSSFL
jgi:hypothetical protein